MIGHQVNQNMLALLLEFLWDFWVESYSPQLFGFPYSHLTYSGTPAFKLPQTVEIGGRNAIKSSSWNFVLWSPIRNRTTNYPKVFLFVGLILDVVLKDLRYFCLDPFESSNLPSNTFLFFVISGVWASLWSKSLKNNHLFLHTLRIMGSQVTGGYGDPTNPCKKHIQTPLYIGGLPVILRGSLMLSQFGVLFKWLPSWVPEKRLERRHHTPSMSLDDRNNHGLGRNHGSWKRRRWRDNLEELNVDKYSPYASCMEYLPTFIINLW